MYTNKDYVRDSFCSFVDTKSIYTFLLTHKHGNLFKKNLSKYVNCQVTTVTLKSIVYIIDSRLKPLLLGTKTDKLYREEKYLTFYPFLIFIGK